MADKKIGMRFTLQFNRVDPLHRQAADILNQLERYGKAQYIADAILHYESCDKSQDAKRPARFDEKVIEAVVKRLLRERGEIADHVSADSIQKTQAENEPQFAEEIFFDEAMDALGQDGFDAVAGALDMFRRK